MKRTVVAALVWQQDRLLICQRAAGDDFPGKWEFPGGKVERGEERLAALRRELNEELGITVISAAEVFRYRHKYANKIKVHLVFFKVDEYDGPIHNFGFERLVWVALEELEKLDFLEGDRPLIEKIVRREIPCCCKRTRMRG